jgi:PKD domain
MEGAARRIPKNRDCQQAPVSIRSAPRNHRRNILASRGIKEDRVRVAASACLALLALAAWAAPARAADSVYWSNPGGNPFDLIRVGNLDGSGAASTLFTESIGSSPEGVAIDAAANRIYWAGRFDDAIRVGNLDGSGAPSTLFTEPADSEPFGVAIDPAANRIYWTSNARTIRAANLDGSGAASTLFTDPAGNPTGVAIDPAANRIYWGNFQLDQIRVGNLDGSGAASTLIADQDQAGAGVAIDPASNRIFWTSGQTIRAGNLDGSGAPSTLFTEPVGTMPFGIAIDPAANRIYWGNNEDAIRVGNLDGSGVASTLFPDPGSPVFPVLLRSPGGIGAPAVSGGGQVGQPLSCSQGSWAPNLLGAFLYRAPRSFAYAWLLNGTEITGASANTYTPTAAGSYACRVTATNQAGSTSQTSAAFEVTAASAGKDPKCKKLRKKRKRQKRGLAKAGSEAKRSMIQANIKDTKRRLRRLGC